MTQSQHSSHLGHCAGRFSRVFGSGTVLLPVIYPISMDDALVAARCAVSAGCAGVWVINQGGVTDAGDLVRLAGMIQEDLGTWTGVNILGYSLDETLAVCTRDEFVPNGVWTDHVDASPRGDWGGLYFGGVAFELGGPPPDNMVKLSAAWAIKLADVVLTSGSATGKPPSLSKVHAFRVGLRNHPGGLASGMTPENIAEYLPMVDVLLVDKGIEARVGVFDADRVQALQKLVSKEHLRRSTMRKQMVLPRERVDHG